MKAITLLVALALAGTCTAPPPSVPEQQEDTKPVTLRVLRTGSYAASGAEPQVAVATDAGTYRTLWTSLVGRDEPQAVDFTKESAVFLILGEKPTGGYSIEPKSTTVDGSTLVINADTKSPPPDAMVTQAFTTPFAVIAVGTTNVTDVRWSDGGRTVASSMKTK